MNTPSYSILQQKDKLIRTVQELCEDTNSTSALIETKQDKLHSGSNIKTLNGQSLLGSGDITIGGGGEVFVQEQADWNESDSSNVSFIKNKPKNVSVFTNDAGYMTEQDIFDDLAAVAVSGDYADLKNTPDIPDISSCIKKSATAGLVKNNGTIDTNTYYQKPQTGIPASDLASGVVPSVDYPVVDVQLSTGSSVVSNKVATIPNVYMHNIAIEGDNTTRIYTTLITSFATAFDIDSFIAYINNLSSPGGFMCTGTVRTNSSGIATGRTAARIVPGSTSGTIGISYHDTGDAGVAGPIYYSKGSGSNQIHNLTDSVIPVIL